MRIKHKSSTYITTSLAKPFIQFEVIKEGISVGLYHFNGVGFQDVRRYYNWIECPKTRECLEFVLNKYNSKKG